jgi:multidrug efflux system outer membrane protein
VNRTIAAAALLALSACSFAPVVKRPDAPAAKHRFAESEDPKSLADLPWWDVYKDPTLQALIRESLAANEDLRLALSRVEEARANAGIAKADFWPQVNASVDALYGQSVSKNILPGATERGFGALQLGVSWELDLWGRVRNGSTAAVAQLLATEEGRRSVVLALVSGVAQAYLELRELDLELQIARANTGVRQGTLTLFENRAKGGVASDLEVNQSRADLAVTRAAIPATEALIAFKEHQLCVLLGRPPGPIARGADLVATQVPPQIPAGVPASLLERRPDLRAAEQQVYASAALVGVAVANRFPTLSLTGLIGLEGRSAAQVFTADGLIWNAGGSLLAPIFQGGRLSSAEEASRARLEQSWSIYRRSVQVALREVSDAAVATQKTREVRVEKEVEVRSTKEAARLAMLRYEGGVSSYLEVLDAQRRQFTSELELAQSRRDELLAVVSLYKSLGGGWQEAPPAKGDEGQKPAPSPLPAPAPAPAQKP